PHTKTDAKKIDADFLAFSSHKMLGPTGVGVLYGKKELLEKMPPFLTGGDMILKVTKQKSEWNKLPWKFEAGTPNIEGAIGFAAALDYLKKIGMDTIHEHEQMLLKIALKGLAKIEGVELYGPAAAKRTGISSFNLKGVHPHDVAQILDNNAIAIRSGNHCAQPLLTEMKVEGVARASFYIYNTPEEINRLCKGVEEAKKVFGA
ncbi:MAG: aminotransferase class V-fold PLP-dependent enzyme, partial [archaeon]|nr:aminotransferase class V-fold PLP-dependent enzyme [archaeon]